MDAGPIRRVPEVGQLLAKGEVFERQLRAGAEDGIQRSKEAYEQGGHGWIMHECWYSWSDRSSIVVAVGKMFARMTSWRRTTGRGPDKGLSRLPLRSAAIGAIISDSKALPAFAAQALAVMRPNGRYA